MQEKAAAHAEAIRIAAEAERKRFIEEMIAKAPAGLTNKNEGTGLKTDEKLGIESESIAAKKGTKADLIAAD